MMDGKLVGAEIHGFHTLHDLDVQNTLEEARTRWLRPNEIHAILCNYKYFSINAKPLNLPPSGTIRLFDRKVLRNFRKDGHNWKKKNDGKTVKEAHEHLKYVQETAPLSGCMRDKKIMEDHSIEINSNGVFFD